MSKKKRCETKKVPGIHYGPMTWDGNQEGRWKCQNCGRCLWDE